MASESVEFANGAAELEQARQLRARAGGLRGARGVGTGVTYGLAAYGHPLGAITGVQQPFQSTEMPLGEQFGGGGTTDAGSGDGGGTA